MTTVPEGFDLADPEVQQDPYPHYDALRDASPVYVPANDSYLVLHHEHVLQVLHDPATFSSRLGSGRSGPPEEVREEVEALVATGLPRPRTLLDNDPPDHSRFRRLVSRSFTPRRMEALRPFVTDLCDELIDAWDDPDSVEFVEEFGVPLPVRVIAHALNIPESRRADFKKWSDANTATIGATVTGEEFLENTRSILEMQQFFVGEFEKRRDDPQDDLFTQLLTAHVGAEDDGSDAEPFEMAELVRIVQQLLVAGYETTTKMLAETLRLIADTPGEWDRIRADPTGTVPSVVEEGLRMSSPNQGLTRIATRDAEVGGVTIPEGSRVVVMYASANRDPAVFGCPHDYDPARERIRDHVAFGHGIHYCVGANLARLEANVALEVLARRVRSYRLLDDNTFEYLPSHVLRGLKRLHIAVTLA